MRFAHGSLLRALDYPDYSFLRKVTIAASAAASR
jgi:hypothetical protein